MISDTDKYHGLVFSKIIRNGTIKTDIERFASSSGSSYVINGVGLYIKYSSKRMSPWAFTFLREHQSEITEMHKKLNKIIIVLVCGDDGIASLNYSEFRLVLDDNHELAENISVSRPPRGKYRISGRDGKLNKCIGQNEFPGKLLNG